MQLSATGVIPAASIIAYVSVLPVLGGDDPARAIEASPARFLIAIR